MALAKEQIELKNNKITFTLIGLLGLCLLSAGVVWHTSEEAADLRYRVCANERNIAELQSFQKKATANFHKTDIELVKINLGIKAINIKLDELLRVKDGRQ